MVQLGYHEKGTGVKIPLSESRDRDIIKRVLKKRQDDGRSKMGIYLNPGAEQFEEIVRSEIYVDKTGLLRYTNSIVNTMQKYICVSRPRRFGKSVTAAMLAAYYSRECDSRKLFSSFAIAEANDFEKYLNRYDTIFLNMQEFLSRSKDIHGLIKRVRNIVIRDLKNHYPDVDYYDDTDMSGCMQDVYVSTRCPFVVIIDEWDCIFREYKRDREAQEMYLDFLRDLLKDKSYIHLVYMTGILPIKKYGTHSALNMFDEFSMIDPGPLAEYVGFTEKEVEDLCERYSMDPEEVKEWYDGYSFENVPSVYSPRSVVNCMRFRKIGNYWNQSAQGALEQIKSKEYCRSLSDYQGDILLVGVNYDKKTKEHTCVIEEDVKV